MASIQPSLLRQAIAGQTASLAEGDPAAAPVGEAGLGRQSAGDLERTSAVVRAPVLVPMPRNGPGHAGHMKLLFENAPVAMAMFDTEMRYLLANRRWLEDFKLTDLEVTGRSQYELFPTLHPGWRHV